MVRDVSEMQKYVGCFGGQWTPKFFEYWINKFDMNKHKKILDTLEKFLDSNASMLSIEHTQKNF